MTLRIFYAVTLIAFAVYILVRAFVYHDSPGWILFYCIWVGVLLVPGYLAERRNHRALHRARAQWAEEDREKQALQKR